MEELLARLQNWRETAARLERIGSLPNHFLVCRNLFAAGDREGKTLPVIVEGVATVD